MPTSVAEKTRNTINSYPFIYRALQADILNHTATASFLLNTEETESVAAAVRRYQSTLPTIEQREARITVRVLRSITVTETDTLGTTIPLLSLGQYSIVDSDGDHTALILTGQITYPLFAAILSRLSIANIEPAACSFVENTAYIIVANTEQITALRLVEETTDSYYE